MTTFTQEEIIKLKELLFWMTGAPIPFDKQKVIFNEEGRCLWCEEWETLEMIKYIFRGKETYLTEPPPNRLKNSTIWSREVIAEKTEKVVSEANNIEELIGYFKNRRDLYDST